MKKNKIQKNILPVDLEKVEVRRVWHEEQWFFVINDIVGALARTPDAFDYVKKMRRRDKELVKGWGQIVTPLTVSTKGGKQKMNCANLQDILRIIQSIPSPKAELFKQWLANVGQERIEEMQNPELSLNRSREYWKKMGKSEKWIQQRMVSQETGNKLADLWKGSGVKKEKEHAILTDIIHHEWSDFRVRDHKQLKGLSDQNNLSDHMSEVELVFTALVESSTHQTEENVEAKGLE